MSRWSAAHARGEDDEPRWVETANDETSAPAGGPFAHTYAAIAACDARRPPRRRRRGVLLLLLIALASLGAFVVPLLRSRPARQPAPATTRPAGDTPRSTAPDVIEAAPAAENTALHVDQPGDFAIVARGGNLRYGWTLDGRAAGTGPRWVWTPGAGDVGEHKVTVTVLGPGGGVTREWTVRVEPAPLVAARTPPPAPAKETPPAIDASGETPAPPAPETPPAAEATPPRAAEPPPPPAPAVASRPEPAPAPSPDVAPADEPPARRPADDARIARRRNAPPPEKTARADRARGTNADVRRWLQRWAAAWNAHDVDALGRMGQMATARDADAVRRYLSQVSDLEVSVDLVDYREEGDHVVVRFVRRDRFRDPAGRLVEHESPPIEKTLLRTGDGFRVVPSHG